MFSRETSRMIARQSLEVLEVTDKYDVRANDAVTLTVKVEGKGNLASIQEPKAKWPESIEIVADFPRTPAGKIKKFELRDRLRGTARS